MTSPSSLDPNSDRRPPGLELSSHTRCPVKDWIPSRTGSRHGLDPVGVTHLFFTPHVSRVVSYDQTESRSILPLNDDQSDNNPLGVESLNIPEPLVPLRVPSPDPLTYI